MIAAHVRAPWHSFTMTASSPPLLTEIERDLLDGKPVADVLRKLIILGGRAGSSELRDWASQELRGYADASLEELPDYRKVLAIIQVDVMVGRDQMIHFTISPSQLPESARAHIGNKVPLPQGVGELQAIVDGSGEGRTIRIALPNERELARLMDASSPQRGLQHTTAVYWSVSASAVEGLIDQVRTRLAELLGEIRAQTPPTADVPTAAQASNAVSIVLHGKGHRVQVSQADDGSEASAVIKPEANDGRFWTLGRRIGATVVGLATIAATVIAWWQLQAGS